MRESPSLGQVDVARPPLRAGDARWQALPADGTFRLPSAVSFQQKCRYFLLEGCIDVDVAVTPITNTLPVRRRRPRHGEARDVRVVYVEVPGLRVRPAAQRYHGLRADVDASAYRYESGDFSAELTFDARGFVRTYGGLWARCGA